jgi:GNAT superfamily N-acetyltransferase
VTLFSAGSFRAFEMADGDMSAAQRLFEANPDYHRMIGGRPPEPDEALQEFASPPFEFRKKWCVGFLDEEAELVGVAGLFSDIFGKGVWTVGLFFVATSLHGGGAALTLYDALEGWMRGEGAHWSRLGVVEGNARAARFWEKSGYTDVRKREGVEMGERINTLRVMVKPLAGGTVAQYLALVARDRPESP